MILPTRMVQTAMGQVQEMTLREVEIDAVEIGSLTPPSSITTLLGGPNDR